MSINDDSFVFLERVAENNVRGFASDSGELDELLHRVRNLPVVPLDQSPAKADQAPRLVTEEPGALDDLLQFFGRRIGERRGRRKSPKEQRSHHVHALVGALGAQDGGDRQLEWRLVVELSARIGIFALETRKNLERVGTDRVLRDSARPCLSHRSRAELSPRFPLAPSRFHFGGLALHLLRLFCANASTSSALRVLRISAASSHAFLAIPIPKCTLSSAAVECPS